MKPKYQIGDTVDNPNLSLTVKESSLRHFGTKGRKAIYYLAVCKKCGHCFPGVVARTLAKRKRCPGCEKQPAALKTDQAGNCISICEIGTVEFIREFQEEHGMSERAAVRHFIDTVKAHLSEDDPAVVSMTEESVLAKVRRSTGKKKDSVTHGDSPQKKNVGKTKENNSKVYQIAADLESVQSFLDEYLPGYKIIKAIS